MMGEGNDDDEYLGLRASLIAMNCLWREYQMVETPYPAAYPAVLSRALSST